MKTLALTLFALAELATATPLPKSPIEVSTNGGTYSIGAGSTFTTFTINSFDIIVTYQPDIVMIPVVGTFTMPSATYGPTIAGQINFLADGNPVTRDVYAGVNPTADPNVLKFGVQITGFNDSDGIPQLQANGTRILEFYFPATLATPGSTATFGMQAVAVDFTPEPATIPLTLAGLGLLWWGRRLARGNH